MVGIKKIYARKDERKIEKAVFENQGSHSPDDSPIRNKPPLLSRLFSLHTIADSDHEEIGVRSKSLLTVTRKFGKMTRDSCNFLVIYYCKKFTTLVTELSFNKKAKDVKNILKIFSEKDILALKRLKIGDQIY